MKVAYDQLDIEIMIVDDDEGVRVNTSDLLSTIFKKITTYDSSSAALQHIQSNAPMVILTDLRMPDGDGFEFAQQVQTIDPELPVILMTGYGDISIAVDAMKQGLYDFIEKPFDTDRLIETIKRAVDKRALTLSLLQTRHELASHSSIDSKIIGQCPAMKQLKQQIVELAPMDIPIMIYGETGSGKELVARSLHEDSARKDAPFVALNCAAIPEQLAEAELFGYEKGAFTDAATARVGKLQHATGGTLFLDEVESLPLMTQAKLLRALSDQIVTPLGSNKEVALNCRILSATKDELRNNKQFRQDLFFRLQVAELRIPPLRQRAEDIVTLFEFFASQQCEHFGTHYQMANRTTRQALMQYEWQGNVRELINVATRYAIRGCSGIETAMDMDSTGDVGSMVDAHTNPEQRESLKEQVSAYEEQLIRSKLAEHQGKVSLVLDDLRLERRTFNQKLNKYGISAGEYK